MLGKFSKVSTLNFVVIGDIMLDEYIIGAIHRMSPEAPVPVVEKQETKNILGGAANVAANLQSLGANVHLVGLVGRDAAGSALSELINQEIKGEHTLIRSDRSTTLKSRITVNGSQLMRVDTEDTYSINQEEKEKIYQALEKHISKGIDGVIFQDYNKGIFTPDLIERLIKKCNNSNILTFVDPKIDNFWSYKNVTVFKPNRKELEIATQKNVLTDLAETLHHASDVLDCTHLICTLADQGIAYCSANTIHHIPTQSIDVVDVSGAGDTTLAMITICITLGYEMKEVATLSNIAGRIACLKSGVSSIDLSEIEAELTSNS